MRHVLIENLKGGEILAQSIFDKNGAELLTGGTTYKLSYFNRLKELEIEKIYIHDTKSNEQKIKTTNTSEIELLHSKTNKLIRNQLKRFELVGSIQVCKFEKIVFEIINKVLETREILEVLYDIKEYDNYTYEHSVNVTIVAIMICLEMEVSDNEIYQIAMGCILHDLGKTNVAEEILNKPSALSKSEFDVIKKHTIDGYKLVMDHPCLDDSVKMIILTHHEKLDGSGYPLGLSGEEISFGARVCAIADVFDAMCSNRPYKKAMSFAESLRTIKMTLNKQLDMEIFTYLEKILESK